MSRRILTPKVILFESDSFARGSQANIYKQICLESTCSKYAQKQFRGVDKEENETHEKMCNMNVMAKLSPEIREKFTLLSERHTRNNIFKYCNGFPIDEIENEIPGLLWHVAFAICSVLNEMYMFPNPILHGDLHSGNVMLCRIRKSNRFQVKLIDFGSCSLNTSFMNEISDLKMMFSEISDLDPVKYDINTHLSKDIEIFNKNLDLSFQFTHTLHYLNANKPGDLYINL